MSVSSAIQDFFEQTCSIAVVCNSFINSTFVHIYVGINVFILVCSSDLSELAGTVRIIVAILISYLVIFVGYTIYSSLTTKSNPFRLIHKLMPVFVINISSASFSASFQSSYETLMNNGVNCDYLNLGLNIGGVLFKPAHALLFVVSTMMFASVAGITISLQWLIMLILLSILLSASLPCIPGASISGFAIIFPQLGIPAEYLTLAITMNAIVDLFTVAVDVYCLQNECIIGSSHMKMIDREKFLRD